MNVAVCFNLVPAVSLRGESIDRIAEEGAELEARAVAAALTEIGHTPRLIALGEDVTGFATELHRLQPDVVFNLCEAYWGDSRKEMHVAALLDLLGFAYTGASPLTLGLTQDKARTKDLLSWHQLPTPNYFLVNPSEHYSCVKDLTYPLIVKPCREDASQGISTESVVYNEENLRARIDYVHMTYHQGALVEEFIEGREINLAILGNGPHDLLPPSEIRFHPELELPIVSYEGKWLEQSQHYKMTEPVCPAPLEAQTERQLRDIALRAYTLLECRDYARVDVRLRDGTPYILEVNANPDVSPDAGLARSARQAGMSYPQLIGRILAMASNRKR